MKEISLRHEQPKIKIDGIVFDLRMSDYEIIQFGEMAIKRFDGYTTRKHSPAEVISDLKYLRGVIDSILGKGAMAKLGKGMPVSIALSIEWIADITTAVSEEYAERAARD